MDTPSRGRRLGVHLKRNVVAYLALMLAVSMSPLPSWAAGQIGTSDLKKNAVTSVKIKNGQVKKADIAAGARGYTKIVTKRVTISDVDINETVSATARCDAGSIAIAGGASVSPSGDLFLGGSAGQIQHSVPVSPFTIISPNGTTPSGDGAEPVGWRTEITNNSGANDRTASFYALCASK